MMENFETFRDTSDQGESELTEINRKLFDRPLLLSETKDSKNAEGQMEED